MQNKLFQWQFCPLFTLCCCLGDPVSPPLLLVLALRTAEATGICRPIVISLSDPINSAFRACGLQFDNSNRLGDKGDELDIVIYGEERPWNLKENVVKTDQTTAVP